MSMVSHYLETYYIDAEEDEQAATDLRDYLTDHAERAQQLQQDWQAVLERHDPSECRSLVNDHAQRGPGDGEACWRWLQAQYQQVFA